MHTDGRFLHLSGLRMVASWQRPEQSRVLDLFLESADGGQEPLDALRSYTIAMPSFIAKGYDGFTWFPQAETIVGEEAAMIDTDLLLSIFEHGHGDGDGLSSSHGGGGVSGGDNGTESSPHAAGIERARTVIVVGRGPEDSLPVVKPVVEGRIRFVEE